MLPATLRISRHMRSTSNTQKSFTILQGAKRKIGAGSSTCRKAAPLSHIQRVQVWSAQIKRFMYVYLSLRWLNDGSGSETTNPGWLLQEPSLHMAKIQEFSSAASSMCAPTNPSPSHTSYNCRGSTTSLHDKQCGGNIFPISGKMQTKNLWESLRKTVEIL